MDLSSRHHIKLFGTGKLGGLCKITSGILCFSKEGRLSVRVRWMQGELLYLVLIECLRIPRSWAGKPVPGGISSFCGETFLPCTTRILTLLMGCIDFFIAVFGENFFIWDIASIKSEGLATKGFRCRWRDKFQVSESWESSSTRVWKKPQGVLGNTASGSIPHSLFLFAL